MNRRAKKKSILILAGLLFIFACNKNKMIPESEGPRMIQLTLKADTPGLPGTRTQIEEYNNGELHPWWSKNDAISVIPLSGKGLPFTKFSSGLTQECPTAIFYGETYYNEGNPYRAVYPYLNWLDNGGNLFSFDNEEQCAVLCVFNTQHPTASSFDKSQDLLISDRFYIDETENMENVALSQELYFRRFVAIVRINLIDDTTEGLFSQKVLKSVRLEVEESVHLAGFYGLSILADERDAFVYEDPTKWEESFIQVVPNQLVADYGEGNSENGFKIGDKGKAVWMCTLPATIKSGSTISISGETYEYSPTKFLRSITLQKDIPLPAGEVTTLTVHLNSGNLVTN